MKTQQQQREPVRLSRRSFLGTVGGASLVLGAGGFLGAGPALAQRAGGARFFMREDRFGRMFPGLPAFARPSAQLSAALMDIGKPGGVLDAKDNLAAGPVALIRPRVRRAARPRPSPSRMRRRGTAERLTCGSPGVGSKVLNGTRRAWTS